jgi:LacI family transcriptional regulator
MGNSTMKDVAKESGVSIATVSRVLNGSGYVSEEVKERVRFVVNKLNYQPNAVARSLKQRKTNTIGIIIPDILNPYFMSVAKGIEDIVYKEGFNLIFSSSDENPKKEKELLQLLYEKRVDAIILATAGGNNKKIIEIKKAGVPIILIDRRIQDLDNITIDLLEEDNFNATYRLTMELINKGHTKLGAISGSLDVSTGFDRLKGYQEALKDSGLEIDEKFIYIGNFSKESGRKATDYFLNFISKPTAIVSLNNMMTHGVLMELMKRGYRVPEDFELASYGEVDVDIMLHSPQIISVKQLPYEMGRETGGILLKHLKNGDKGPFYKKFDPLIYP